MKMKSYCMYPAKIYLIKVNNRNTRTRCEICSKLITKTPERRYRLLFTNFAPFSSVFIDCFQQVNVCWVCLYLFLNQIKKGYQNVSTSQPATTCSKLTIKTPELCVVHISHLVLVFILLTLNM